MSITLFAALRALHILAAALWLGAAALLTLYIIPAIRGTGVAGGTLMAEMVRRGFHKFMAVTAGLTILSGLWLYWLWAESVGAGGTRGVGGIMLVLGALAGIAAAVIGGAILGRGSEQLAALAAEPAGDARVAALHARMATASKIALALLVVGLLLMALSRFA